MKRGIYRCPRGHLFARAVTAMLREANLRLGRHVEKCLIDGELVVVVRMRRQESTPGEIAEAETASKR